MNDTQSFAFNLEHNRGVARAGTIETNHGSIQTPIFMPVGTLATVKSLDTQDLEQLQAQIILGNTYHLYLRPGLDVLRQMGGMHGLMDWRKPILSDSGGYQVFSLGAQSTEKTGKKFATIDESGVAFKSHLDGTSHYFSPQIAVDIQRVIGADIIMAFDECTPDQADERTALQALDRTHRWADASLQAWEQAGRQSEYGYYQALFGIVQGALHQDMRQQSARYMAERPFDGVAVGGETVGYNMAGTATVMSWIESLLPTEKPRYAMGLGRDPDDLVSAVLQGFDMFDCVGPTRLGRNGALYYGQLELRPAEEVIEKYNLGALYAQQKSGEAQLPSLISEYSKARLRITRSEFATDPRPIMEQCTCHTCQAGYSRAYLHHLAKADELTYYRLASIHNVHYMVALSQQLRTWVVQGTVSV